MGVSRQLPRIALRTLASIAAIGLMLADVRGDSGTQTTYSGQATAVRATILGQTTTISDTGPLPPSGGALQASLLTAQIPGVLTAEVLHATTVGQSTASMSEASAANVTIVVGGNTVSADFLMSRARAMCTKNGVVVSGSSDVVNLVVNNTAIAVSGQPNETVALPNGRVVINEQTESVSRNSGEMTTNALHVVVNGVADVIVSFAHADITCQGSGTKGGDFVTGGGWILGPSGAKANFGVAGGIKNSALWGHLEYIDHGINLKVHGTDVTDYEVVGTVSRMIRGTCDINGSAGTYQVVVADNDDIGQSADTFSISLSNGYSASGTLGGGDIQLHPPGQ